MKCEIIRDLLPAYCDGVCSPDAAAEIEQHTAECSDCAKLMADFKSEITTPEAEASAPKKPFKKIKKSIFRNKLVIAFLTIVLLIVVGITGLLTYGQIIRDPNVPSFETVIASKRAEKLITKLCEGDIDYVMSDITITTYDYENMLNENCRSLLTQFSEMIKYKSPKIIVKDCLYTENNIPGVLMPEAEVSVKADGLPYIDFHVYEIGDKSIVGVFMNDRDYTYSQSYDELDMFIRTLDFALCPYMTPSYSGEQLVINAESYLPDTAYYLFAEKYSDSTGINPAYSDALNERVLTLNEKSVHCDSFIKDGIKFDSDSKRYLADITACFTDPDNGEKIVYMRTIQVVNPRHFVILDEYAPEIIDGGVTPETREMIENLF